jgi:hypothetical protein
MKLNRILVSAGLVLICVFYVQHVQARGPSTREERAKVVELARWLELNPLAHNAAETRQWLREWIADVPDISFWVCTDLLGQALDKNYAYSREINEQVLFSGAAFTLKHQDKRRDEIAVYTAGVEGALRAYGSLSFTRRTRPPPRTTEFYSEHRIGLLPEPIFEGITNLFRARRSWLSILFKCKPSRLKSPTASEWGEAPILRLLAAPKPPLPLRFFSRSLSSFQASRSFSSS